MELSFEFDASSMKVMKGYAALVLPKRLLQIPHKLSNPKTLN